jgi:small subunit ribosomal protein S1
MHRACIAHEHAANPAHAYSSSPQAGSKAGSEAAALLSSYKRGDVVTGVVTGVVEPNSAGQVSLKNTNQVGATMRVDGTAVIGHLHITQISHERITSIDTLLREGDSLKAMVLDVDGRRSRGRLSLSTKSLEPSPGDMLRDKQLVFDKAEETAEAWMKEKARMKAVEKKAVDKESSPAWSAQRK